MPLSPQINTVIHVPVFQDIPLAAPVTMMMRASVASTEDIPSCSYYNEETDLWDSNGLAIDSIEELSVGEEGEVDVEVVCLSFHLSDFTVTTTEVEPVFQPVTLVSTVVGERDPLHDLFDQPFDNVITITFE